VWAKEIGTYGNWDLVCYSRWVLNRNKIVDSDWIIDGDRIVDCLSLSRCLYFGGSSSFPSPSPKTRRTSSCPGSNVCCKCPYIGRIWALVFHDADGGCCVCHIAASTQTASPIALTIRVGADTSCIRDSTIVNVGASIEVY
jgi:hypothetical protein